MISIRQTIEIKDTSNGNDGAVTVEIVTKDGVVLSSATERSTQATVVEQTATKSGRWEYQLPKVQEVARSALEKLQRLHDRARDEMRRQGLLK